MTGVRASRRLAHHPCAIDRAGGSVLTVPAARRRLFFKYPPAYGRVQRRDLCRVVLVLGGDGGITDSHEPALSYLTSVAAGPDRFSSRAFDSATASCTSFHRSTKLFNLHLNSKPTLINTHTRGLHRPEVLRAPPRYSVNSHSSTRTAWPASPRQLLPSSGSINVKISVTASPPIKWALPNSPSPAS